MNVVLPVFDKAASYQDYDTIARSLPDCEHNEAWWKQGPGRPPPPDCEHNRSWRARLRAAWETYCAALHNDLEACTMPARTGRLPAITGRAPA